MALVASTCPPLSAFQERINILQVEEEGKEKKNKNLLDYYARVVENCSCPLCNYSRSSDTEEFSKELKSAIWCAQGQFGQFSILLSIRQKELGVKDSRGRKAARGAESIQRGRVPVHRTKSDLTEHRAPFPKMWNTSSPGGGFHRSSPLWQCF